MPYLNLPGSYVELQDGNLSFFTRDTTQSVLVLGTAPKGLTSEPFLVTDLASVVKEFGATSELAKTASEVRKGDARNIFVYRLPGVAPSVSAIGADTRMEGGIKITTAQESPEAAAKYGVAYRHAKNIATSGAGAANEKSVTGELIVVNLETDTVVWQGTALEGATLDNGEVDVDFDLGDVDLGIGTGPELQSIEFGVSTGSKTYTPVASTYQTSGLGTGATFTVQGVPTFAGTGDYSTTTIMLVAGGSNYAVDDSLKVLGGLLGGVNSTNDLTLDVASITAAGREYTNVTLTSGTSSDARATIQVSAVGGYTVIITNPGTGYTAGDITVLGTDLGGASPANDATISVTVDGGGAIDTASVAGTGKIRGTLLTFDNVAGTYALQGVDSLSYSFHISGINATGTYSTGAPYTTANSVATALAAALAANSEFLKLPFSASASTNAVHITANGIVNSSGEVVYGASHPWAGYTARPHLTQNSTVTAPLGQGTISAYGDIASSTARAFDIGLYPQDSNKPFALVAGGVYIPLDKVVSGATVQSYGLEGQPFVSLSLQDYAGINFDYGTSAIFSSGSTGESISAMKRYERLHTAFENLDLAAFDFVVCSGIAVDSKNAADSSVTFTEDTYPTPRTAVDALGFCEIIDNGDYTYKYLWSDDQEVLKIVSDGTLAEDWTATTSFAEVNFAHLVAKYCYENSSDYKSVMGVIGTTLPDSIASRGLRAYFGESPSYSYDNEQNAYFIEEAANNGVGLLGHKLIGGQYDFNGGLKHGGLFATKDGTMDYENANLELDGNDKKIDLGKYLCVVAIFGRVTDDVNPRNPAYLTNAAPIIAGMLPLLSPANSLINMRVPGLTIDYRLETKTVDTACGLGLIVAKNENGVAFIADSPTFACESSDYTRLTTMRIVGKIAEELRQVARPYIGKGLSATKRAALESAISGVLSANLAGEPVQTITRGAFKVEQSAQDITLGKMKVSVTIVPVFELRQITFSVSLTAQ